jgi:hypothetical protein
VLGEMSRPSKGGEFEVKLLGADVLHCCVGIAQASIQGELAYTLLAPAAAYNSPIASSAQWTRGWRPARGVPGRPWSAAALPNLEGSPVAGYGQPHV